MDARLTETCVTPTCVAPKHVDASRDFYFYFLRTSSVVGGGGGWEGGARCRLFFSPCSADHERDWPPCKVVFFGLATNALNVRNNNNNNQTKLGYFLSWGGEGETKGVCSILVPSIL